MKTTLVPRSLSRIEALEARIAPAAVVNLADLKAAAGFKVYGEAEGDTANISALGDLNADGFADLIVGAPGQNPPGANASAGAVYVVFGRATPFSGPVALASLDGTDGFKISGAAVPDAAGSALSVGDVNGDGRPDLVIGAPRAGGDSSGAAYVIYGKTTGFAANVNLATLASADGFRIEGVAPGDQAGTSVAAVGDINFDGIGDLVIGAPKHGTPSGTAFSGPGAAYVIFGQQGTRSNVPLSSLSTAAGFVLDGAVAGDDTGFAVASAGDVNGDGLGDVLIGAPGADVRNPGSSFPLSSGAAYVVFGRSSVAGVNVALATLDGAAGFKIKGDPTRFLAGNAVASAGDFNGDGVGDVLIGGSDVTVGGATPDGVAYVVFGRTTPFAATLELANLASTAGVVIRGKGDDLGATLASAGDLNGDGRGDLLLSARGATPGGAAYVVFGRATPFPSTFTTADLNGTTGYKIAGVAGSDVLGASVSAGRDLNGDGLGDLVIGATGVQPGGVASGATWVVYGSFDSQLKIAANGRSATFTDFDGDRVTVRVSKGRLAPEDFTFRTTGGLALLDLDADRGFQNANLSITAVKVRGGTGDGRVNVGAIDASELDLGTVTVSGDLGQFDAGDRDFATAAVRRLQLGSLGVEGQTQIPGTLDPKRSEIVGRLGALVTTGDLAGFLDVNGVIGAVTIGGDLDGSAGGEKAGLIASPEGIGNVAVKGNILGGADATGIISRLTLGRVTVSGDVVGTSTARVTIAGNAADALAVGGVKVFGKMENARVIAGFNLDTGATSFAGAGIGPVTIIGAAKNASIRATGLVGAVTIGGDLDGSAGGTRSGLIEGGTGVGAVTVKGSIIGGADFSGILSGGKLGRVSIGGDLRSATEAKPVAIAALGQLGATKAADALAIAGLKVAGDVSQARILAGYGVTLAAANPDASIGAVTVAGDWTASSLVAGVRDATVDGFGRNDARIAGDTTPTIFATIGPIVIQGTSSGSATAGTFYGITAERLTKLTRAGTTTTYVNGTADLVLLGVGNFRAVDFS